MNTVPTLYYMVGLPGSGKSSYYGNIYCPWVDTAVHSSDKLREELLGDVNNQDKNSDIFVELHRRIKDDLRQGFSVIYDATNIKKKNRMAFLREIERIPCYKKCICIMTPYEDCVRFNNARERKVPEEVIKRMYTNFNPPSRAEGFDDIIYYFNFSDKTVSNKYYILDLFNDTLFDFDQKNKHHSAFLGDHCLEAYDYIRINYPDDKNLAMAALLHDIGKVFTKSELNSKGENDGDCHYYNHHCVSAYDSLFYLNKLGMTVAEMEDISNLIYYHMHPYLSWKQSEKSLNRDKQIMGDEFVNRVYRLHTADLEAH